MLVGVSISNLPSSRLLFKRERQPLYSQADKRSRFSHAGSSSQGKAYINGGSIYLGYDLLGKHNFSITLLRPVVIDG